MIIKCKRPAGHNHVKAFVVVIIARGKKNKITYHSGLKYFYTYKSAKLFIDKVMEECPWAEFYWVDVHEAHKIPEGEEIPKKKMWCPYCQTIQEFKRSQGGYKNCPICGISDQDFYVKCMNIKYREAKANAKKKLEGSSTNSRDIIVNGDNANPGGKTNRKSSPKKKSRKVSRKAS